MGFIRWNFRSRRLEHPELSTPLEYDDVVAVGERLSYYQGYLLCFVRHNVDFNGVSRLVDTEVDAAGAEGLNARTSVASQPLRIPKWLDFEFQESSFSLTQGHAVAAQVDVGA